MICNILMCICPKDFALQNPTVLQLATVMRLYQKNYKLFFRPIKKILFPVLSVGKDITPAKFQLNQFITVGGVDGQTHTQTHLIM